MSAALVAWSAAIVAGLAGAVAAVFTARRTGGRLRAGALAAGGAVLLAVETVALFTGVALGALGLFGVVHVLYLAAVVGPPVAVLATASLVATVWSADGRRIRADRIVLPVAAMALLAGTVGIFASFVEPGRLEVHDVGTVEVAAARAGTDPVRIAVLADIQTADVGAHEERAVDAAMAERPDLILLPGDVFQGSEDAFDRELPALRTLLGRLHAPGGVFVVEGDVDSVDRLRRITDGTGIRVLDDEIVTLDVRGRAITIGGVSLHSSTDGAHSPVATELEARHGDDDIRILLAHRPDVVLGLPEHGRIDLVAAGHTHGGQVSVPFVGPLMTMSNVPRHVAAGGLHDLGGRRILVSAGIGMERGQAPALRFGVPPSIPVVTLR